MGHALQQWAIMTGKGDCEAHLFFVVSARLNDVVMPSSSSSSSLKLNMGF